MRRALCLLAFQSPEKQSMNWGQAIRLLLLNV